MISPTLVMASAVAENTHNNQCKICHELFGLILNRPTICFKCNGSFCRLHSSEERWNYNKNKLQSICDECISNEREILIKIRVKKLKLKHHSDGTYVNKINMNSREYKKYGLRKHAKMIKINNKNIESFNAQIIANTLNTIDIPYKITLDFSKCDGMHDIKNDINNIDIKRRHSISKTIGYGAPICDKSMQQILNEMIDNKKDDDLVTADHSSTASSNNNNPMIDGQHIVNTESNDISNDISIQEKDGEINELKSDLVRIEEKINEFNDKYDGDKLLTLFNCKESKDTEIFNQIEYILQRLNISNDKFRRKLKEIEQHKTNKKTNNVQYGEWNVNTIISWIRSLENRRFDKYSQKLRFGFKIAGVTKGEQLPFITESYLNGEPFKINNISDCHDLAKYFRNLINTKYPKYQYETEGIQSLQYELNDNWFGINILSQVQSMINLCSMFIEGS